MNTLLHWLAAYGLGFAFLNVLVEQLGLPVPACPVLVITGALSMDGRYSALGLLGVAVLACLLADLAWYWAGRRYGSKVLRIICRLSISPDSCVRQTEALFERWGIWSLLVAKFVPGFATLTTALAGRTRLLPQLRGARITVAELQKLMGSGGQPAIIDVRPALHRERDGRIPGALAWPEQTEGAAAALPRELDVVVYCACPNEVSDAKVARQVQLAGFRSVRPLLGGIDAWIAAGLPVERPASA